MKALQQHRTHRTVLFEKTKDRKHTEWNKREYTKQQSGKDNKNIILYMRTQTRKNYQHNKPY